MSRRILSTGIFKYTDRILFKKGAILELIITNRYLVNLESIKNFPSKNWEWSQNLNSYSIFGVITMTMLFTVCVWMLVTIWLGDLKREQTFFLSFWCRYRVAIKNPQRNVELHSILLSSTLLLTLLSYH